MSADLLRRAAALLCNRALSATPGPWERAADHHLAKGEYGDNDVGFWDGEYAQQVTITGDGISAEIDARYIALMHPPVALALAAWLDDEASATPAGADDWPSVAVARAVLREAA